jgi:hypothetical protein
MPILTLVRNVINHVINFLRFTRPAAILEIRGLPQQENTIQRNISKININGSFIGKRILGRLNNFSVGVWDKVNNKYINISDEFENISNLIIDIQKSKVVINNKEYPTSVLNNIIDGDKITLSIRPVGLYLFNYLLVNLFKVNVEYTESKVSHIVSPIESLYTEYLPGGESTDIYNYSKLSLVSIPDYAKVYIRYVLGSGNIETENWKELMPARGDNENEYVYNFSTNPSSEVEHTTRIGETKQYIKDDSGNWVEGKEKQVIDENFNKTIDYPGKMQFRIDLLKIDDFTSTAVKKDSIKLS